MNKWINIEIDMLDHAYLKAEAQINHCTLKEYVNELIKADLVKKGYNLDRKPQLMAAE